MEDPDRAAGVKWRDVEAKVIGLPSLANLCIDRVMPEPITAAVILGALALGAVHGIGEEASRTLFGVVKHPSPSASQKSDALGAPVRGKPIGAILADWRSNSQAPTHPLYIVLGGCLKYDPARKKLGMKEYQSTEPVRGIVHLTRVLAEVAPALVVDAACDYEMEVRQPGQPLDVLLVGAGDTNRMSGEVLQLLQKGTLPTFGWLGSGV